MLNEVKHLAAAACVCIEMFRFAQFDNAAIA
jgi:hypothetical protein